MCGLDGACCREQRCGADSLAGDLPECVKEKLRRRGWLAHHAINALRTHVQFDGDFVGEVTLLEYLQRQVESPVLGWTRVALVISLEQAEVLCPGISLGIGQLRLEHNERGIAFARKHHRVVTL